MTGVASWGKPGAFRDPLTRASGGETPTPGVDRLRQSEVIVGKSVEGSGCVGIVRWCPTLIEQLATQTTLAMSTHDQSTRQPSPASALAIAGLCP